MSFTAGNAAIPGGLRRWPPGMAAFPAESLPSMRNFLQLSEDVGENKFDTLVATLGVELTRPKRPSASLTRLKLDNSSV